MLEDAAWNKVLITTVSRRGAGKGELHIRHKGFLQGQDKALEKMATTLGGKTESLTEDFWVVIIDDDKEITKGLIKAFYQAIGSLAAREVREAKKADKAARAQAARQRS